MVKLDWRFKEKIQFKSCKEFKDWYTTVLIATCDKNNKVRCNCCSSCVNHKMNMRLLWCSGDQCNKNSACEVRYKILSCENKNQVYHIYQLNEHAEVDAQENIATKKKVRGITNYVKDLINVLIYDKDVSMPKKIHVKLNSKKYIEKRKVEDKVYDVPTLQQIQNYIKYLKGKMFETNKITDVETFVNDNTYYDDIVGSDLKSVKYG